MNRKHIRTVTKFTCAALALAAAATSAVAQPVFTPGGPSPWFFSIHTMRGDGGLLAGSNYDMSTGSQPATWTSVGGVQTYPVPSGTTSGEILALSADASIAAGYSSINGSWATMRATIWQNGVPLDVGYLPGGQRSVATGVSADGSIVVGGSDIGGWQNRAFRWTASGGMENLGTLDDRSSGAVAISGDGTKIGGNTHNGVFNTSRPFRWTASGGMQDLGLLQGGTFAVASRMSADGSAITGFADFHMVGGDREYGIFRWSESLGMEYLGSLGPPFADRTETQPNAISASGEVIVGSAFDADSGPGGFGRYAAVYWTRATGLVDLNTYLPTLGIDLGGYTLSSADAISADGTIIVGSGFAPDGSLTSWMVTGIPAPGVPVLLGIGALSASRRRRAS